MMSNEFITLCVHLSLEIILLDITNFIIKESIVMDLYNIINIY